MFSKRSSILIAIIIVASLSFSIYAALLPEGPLMLRFFNRDDAFYYFKVAQNISEGYGITFDRIAPTNGFHPLWMLICIPFFALSRLDLILPFRLLLIFLGGLNAGTLLLIFRSLRQTISAQAGLVGASIWAFSFPIQVQVARMGLETGLTAFCIVLMVFLTTRAEKGAAWKIKHYLGFGLVATLILLSRLDSIFLVACFGSWLIFRKTNLRYLLIIDMVAATFAVTLSFYVRLGLIKGDLYTIAFRPAAFTMVILAAVIHPLVNLSFGLYKQFPFLNQQPGSPIVRIVLSTLTGSIGIMAIMFIFQAIGYFPAFSRTIPLFEFGLYLLLALFGRGLMQLAVARGIVHEQRFSQIFWKTSITRGIAFFGPVIMALATYMLLNQFYAGTPMPVSGQIKQWWAVLGYTVYGKTPTTVSAYLDQFLSIWAPFNQSIYRPITESLSANGISIWFALAPTIAISSLLAFAFSIWKRRTPARISVGVLIPLLAGSILQFVYYDVSGYVASKEWYWISQMVFLTFALSASSELVVVNIRNIRWRAVVQAVTGITCVILFANYSRVFINNITFSTMPANPYQEEATFIENNTEPGALVGMTGGGTVAYFIENRTVINLDGLINSTEYFSALKENRAGTYLDAIGLDYAYGNDYMLTESIPYANIFQGRLEKIEQISTGTLYLYHSANP